MPESKGCLAVAHIQSHQGFGIEHILMRLRLMDDGVEMAVLEIASAEELRDILTHAEGERLRAVRHLHVHLWHDYAWWNLSDDLSQFFTWVIETGIGTLEETRAFAAAPLSRPDWLFEAALQMKKLLDIVTDVSHSE